MKACTKSCNRSIGKITLPLRPWSQSLSDAFQPKESACVANVNATRGGAATVVNVTWTLRHVTIRGKTPLTPISHAMVTVCANAEFASATPYKANR